MIITTNFYYGGKRKAVTMSYDDGRIYDRKLIDIFNRYGVKGSFHLNSSRIDTEGHVTSDELPKLYEGHEISLHTYTHPTTAFVPREQLIEEIIADRKLLEKYSGRIVKGLSYPMGSYDKDVVETLKSLGVVYGRTTKSHDTFVLPEDFLMWHPTTHHSRGIGKYNPNAGPDREVLMNKAIEFTEYGDWQRTLPLLYVWGHSYEFNNDNTWDVIENFCEYISKFDNIWFATNIEIYEYLTAVKALQFSADRHIVKNPSAMSVWIGVNDKPVEVKGGETLNLEHI